MTPEEIAQLRQLLATGNQQAGDITNGLEESLAAQVVNRDNENAALLQQLQNNFANQQAAVADLAPATAGFQNFVDAATGSNFTRSAEALANQRALIAGGQDPVSRAFADQFAREAELQRSDNITPGQQVNIEAQIANQRRADQKAGLQAELDILKAQQAADQAQFDRDLKIQEQARKERLTTSQINRNNRPPSPSIIGGLAGAAFDPSQETSFIGKAQGLAARRNDRLGIKSSASSLRKDTQGVVDDLKKVQSKSEQNTQRARSALALLQDPRIAATNISQIQTLILKAGGEVGGLTESERNSVSGVNQSFFEQAKAAIRRRGSGTLSESQLTELRRVANIFVDSGERSLRNAAISARNQFRDLGLSDQDIAGVNGNQGLPSLSGIPTDFFDLNIPNADGSISAPGQPAASSSTLERVQALRARRNPTGSAPTESPEAILSRIRAGR